MNQKIIPSLNKFYSSLYNTILKNTSKITNKSILISFFSFKSNDRYKLLSESAIPSYKIPKDILVELENKNLIRATDTLNSYAITAEPQNCGTTGNKIFKMTDSSGLQEETCNKNAFSSSSRY